MCLHAHARTLPRLFNFNCSSSCFCLHVALSMEHSWVTGTVIHRLFKGTDFSLDPSYTVGTSAMDLLKKALWIPVCEQLKLWLLLKIACRFVWCASVCLRSSRIYALKVATENCYESSMCVHHRRTKLPFSHKTERDTACEITSSVSSNRFDTLPPCSENGHNAAFIKHVRQSFSRGSVMQRCERNASLTSSGLRLKPDLCPHQAISQWCNPTAVLIWEALSLINRYTHAWNRLFETGCSREHMRPSQGSGLSTYAVIFIKLK